MPRPIHPTISIRRSCRSPFERSHQAAHKTFEAAGGRSLGYQGYQCPEEAGQEAENTLWGPCTVRTTDRDGEVVGARVFSLIIERDGVFKFVSLANNLD